MVSCYEELVKFEFDFFFLNKVTLSLYQGEIVFNSQFLKNLGNH